MVKLSFEEIEKDLRTQSGDLQSSENGKDSDKGLSKDDSEESDTDTEEKESVSESDDEEEEENSEDSDEEEDDGSGDGDEEGESEDSGDDEESDQSGSDPEKDGKNKADDKSKGEEEKESEGVKELRKRLLSQVSQKSKEVDAALSLLMETASKDGKKNLSLGDVKHMLELQVQSIDLKRQAEREERIFFRNFPDAVKFKKEISAIREENPKLSWKSARNLYLAEVSPELLVQKAKGKKDVFPKSTQSQRKDEGNPEPGSMPHDQLEARALSEIRKMMGHK